MSSAQLYDTIGATYTVTRRTEPRIAARIWAALGNARTVLNVGAGTGSYEPPDRDVTAVEPSALMRAQRPAGAAPCVAATAENLPFEDQSFDATRERTDSPSPMRTRSYAELRLEAPIDDARESARKPNLHRPACAPRVQGTSDICAGDLGH